MGYALFAQRKVQLTGNLNTVSLMQTQRSNEQYMLATQTLSLNQQLSSLQVAQSKDLADMYALLANADEESIDQEYVNRIKNDADTNGTGKSTYDGMTKEARALVDAFETTGREDIQAKIDELELEHQQEQEEINRKIYLVSVKENAIEMEVKRLDTQISAIQQQLKAVEEAEGSAIERATPKFNGVG